MRLQELLDTLDQDQNFDQELLKESEQAYQDYLKDSQEYIDSFKSE